LGVWPLFAMVRQLRNLVVQHVLEGIEAYGVWHGDLPCFMEIITLPYQGQWTTTNPRLAKLRTADLRQTHFLWSSPSARERFNDIIAPQPCERRSRDGYQDASHNCRAVEIRSENDYGPEAKRAM